MDGDEEHYEEAYEDDGYDEENVINEERAGTMSICIIHMDHPYLV